MPDAADMVSGLLVAVRAAVAGAPAVVQQWRPSTGRWSIREYVCHLRDVHIVSTDRLHRTRTEDRPVLEPMLNDLRARRFRYNNCNLSAVLDELDAAAGGFVEEIADSSLDDWDRVATRLPGEQRSARWLMRHAVHETVHHLHDIEQLHASATAPGRQLSR